MGPLKKDPLLSGLLKHYVYANNNPVSMSDPLGLQASWDAIDRFAGTNGIRPTGVEHASRSGSGELGYSSLVQSSIAVPAGPTVQTPEPSWQSTIIQPVFSMEMVKQGMVVVRNNPRFAERPADKVSAAMAKTVQKARDEAQKYSKGGKPQLGSVGLTVLETFGGLAWDHIINGDGKYVPPITADPGLSTIPKPYAPPHYKTGFFFPGFSFKLGQWADVNWYITIVGDVSDLNTDWVTFKRATNPGNTNIHDKFLDTFSNPTWGAGVFVGSQPVNKFKPILGAEGPEPMQRDPYNLYKDPFNAGTDPFALQSDRFYEPRRPDPGIPKK